MLVLKYSTLRTFLKIVKQWPYILNHVSVNTCKRCLVAFVIDSENVNIKILCVHKVCSSSQVINKQIKILLVIFTSLESCRNPSVGIPQHAFLASALQPGEWRASHDFLQGTGTVDDMCSQLVFSIWAFPFNSLNIWFTSLGAPILGA